MKNFKKLTVFHMVMWLAITIISIAFLPNMSKLVADKGQTRVPDTAQSQVASTIQKDWGHNIGDTREVVIVFNNGDDAINESQQANIDNTIAKLRDNQDKYHIKGMTTANDNSETKKQLVSEDKTTELLQLNVSKDQTVKEMSKDIQKAVKTDGIKTYVTGADILNDDFFQTTEEGVKKTEVIAIIFILIVLILVFRSPIVPFISLATVGIAFMTSLSIVMNLADKFDFPISNFTQVFMVVVLFGIGTDYNILLFDQFKNELSRGTEKVEATIKARKIAGKTILYSGSSVLIGFGTLGLSNFSIYQSGVGVAVGVLILLIVLLTVNPFFMTMLGEKMFWPSKVAGENSNNKLWTFLASKSARYAIPAIMLVGLVTIPFALASNSSLNYDSTVELDNKMQSKQGLNVVEKHFSKGTAEPTTIYIQYDQPLDNQEAYQQIDQITRKLQSEKGVKQAASVTQPGGYAIDQLYLKNQLRTIINGLGDAQNGLNQISSGLNSNSSTAQTTANLQAIGGSAQDIATQLQAIQSQMGSVPPIFQAQLKDAIASLQQIGQDTQTIGTNTQQLATQLQGAQGQLAQASNGLSQIESGNSTVSSYIDGLSNSSAGNTFYIPGDAANGEQFQQSVNTYLSEDKKTAKILMVLDMNPSGDKAAKKMDKIQNMVKQNLKGTVLQDATVALGGQTSTINDTSTTANKDFVRTAIIMIAGITIALIFVTRSFLQPMYILGTLLVAYFAALGIGRFVSEITLGQNHLTWTTPFFSFIMLITLGIDYSIFLIMMYRGLKNKNGNSDRMIRAAGIIGTVVISAAVILGGTFAALIPSGVLTLIQVAVVVIIGLILLVFMLPTIISAFITLTYADEDKNMVKSANKK